MRLFIAVNFSAELKKALLNAIEALRAKGVRANFTREENLHLTLAFIGESDRVKDICRAIDSIEQKSFDIALSNGGSFGNLLWVGIDKSAPLCSIASDLRKALIADGFEIDTKPFRAHITVAREASPAEKPHSEAASMTVSRILLMCSERINGKLRYREIYGKNLK